MLQIAGTVDTATRPEFPGQAGSCQSTVCSYYSIYKLIVGHGGARRIYEQVNCGTVLNRIQR